MEIIHSPDEAYRFVMQRRLTGGTVGLVPTMGALHDGHLSLVQESVQQCDHTLATIFVNPTQFAPNEDLDKYPRTLEQDCHLLKAAGTAAVFVPESSVIYPDGFSTFVDPPEVGKSLEGVCRPGHFRGVATIVLKLFQMLPATHGFFGRKDYQQLKVIEAMARDLNVPIQIVGCPIVRENDGLAMSSRNRYLNEQERNTALLLSQSLAAAESLVRGGEKSPRAVELEMRRILTATDGGKGVDKIDYATVVKATNLSPIDLIDDNHQMVALIAAFVGNTRLIDNLEINVQTLS